MTGAHDLRCASLTRAEGPAPLGTAGDHRGYLLVDWPLPCPATSATSPSSPRCTSGAPASGCGCRRSPRPVPDCGKPPDEARKHHDERVLRDVRRVA